MAGRTFVIGDIHGDLNHLRVLLGRLPLIDAKDTVVFLGDYLDRGPQSREVVQVVRALDREVHCNVIALRGNHEDAWLRVLDQGGWPEFVLPAKNGCLATLRSFAGGKPPAEDEGPNANELRDLFSGHFLPEELVSWMRSLPHWYEDEHGIYVHAGLPEKNGVFQHPKEVEKPTVMLWVRTPSFFQNYRGKRIVVGHTVTETLPPELDTFTPEDPNDVWGNESVLAIDTGCGKGGFLTAVELPSLKIYESR